MGKISRVRHFSRGRRRLFAPLAVILLLLTVQTVTAVSVFAPVKVVNTPGFGDRQNSFAWSMALFNGKLYVGTVRNEICLDLVTLQYYFPDAGYYNTNPEPSVTCPADPYDLDLRAEIWQYTPQTGQWLRVYQSPEIPNPRAPGKMVARDIAYRGMVVYHNALYVGGVTADEFIPELNGSNPPRILRTTDGTNFTALDGNPGQVDELTSSGLQYAMGFRSMEVFQDKLFVTASTGLRGDGVIMEVGTPDGATSTFTQVSPLGTMGVFEMEVFNNQLYAGVGDLTNGYSVWRTDGTGPAPFQFTPIVTDGAGRGADITSVVSMHVFQNQLYVGASGWFSTLLPSSELIRIATDDSWQVVVGNARQTTNGYMFPISGLPDGFGNVFNAHFWRMDDRSGALFVGTNDWSWSFKNAVLEQRFIRQAGFDLYMSCNGSFWFPLTINAFGTGGFNFGARTLVSSPDGEYIGTTNEVQGTEILKLDSFVGCQGAAPTGVLGVGGTASTNSAGSSAIAPPQALRAEVKSTGSLLSWNSVSGADHYNVLRAVVGSTQGQGQGISAALQLVLSKLPNDMALPSQFTAGINPTSLGVQPQPYTSIGTTAQTTFVDSTAQPGVQYTYEVVAVAASGQESSPSNIAATPSSSPQITFGQIGAAINGLGTSGALTPQFQAIVVSLLNAAKTAVDQSNPTQALKLLTVLSNQLESKVGSISDQAKVQNLNAMVKLLQRTIMVQNAGTHAGN